MGIERECFGSAEDQALGSLSAYGQTKVPPSARQGTASDPDEGTGGVKRCGECLPVADRVNYLNRHQLHRELESA